MTTRFLITLLAAAALSLTIVGKLCNTLMQDFTASTVFGMDGGFDDA